MQAMVVNLRTIRSRCLTVSFWQGGRRGCEMRMIVKVIKEPPRGDAGEVLTIGRLTDEVLRSRIAARLEESHRHAHIPGTCEKRN